jgi:Na+/H+-dicarboxylate symporter
MFLFLVLARTVPSFAGTEIKLASVSPQYTPTAGNGLPEPVSMQDFSFQVNYETGRARMVVEYTYPDQPAFGLDGGMGPEPKFVQLPGLTYDPVTKAVFSLLGQRGAGAPPLPPGAAEAAQLLAADPKQTFSAWLVSLVPTNPIAAASGGAMLPVILFTLLFALAAARAAPAARETIVGFFRAVSEVMLAMVRWVILAAPAGIFALMLPLTAHAGAGIAGAIGFYIVAYSLLSIGGILLAYPMVAAFGGVPMRRFAQAALEPQLIAFTSSSSVASLPALVESAEKRLGLSKRISGFVLPLAVTTFHFAGPVTWTVGAVFVGWFYGIPLGAREISIVTLASVFLTSAAPGVPRGGFIMLAPLFSEIGLPIEGIGILIALDAIPDTFATAMNVTGDLAAATIVARFDPARESGGNA